METKKTRLSLGKPYDPWNKQQDSIILDFIKPLWKERYPLGVSIKELTDCFLDKYKTTRSRNSVSLRISHIMGMDSFFLPCTQRNYDNLTISIVREYSQSGEASNDKRDCRYESRIQVLQEGDNHILYIHPTDMDADYYEVFKRVLCINDKTDQELKKEKEKLGRVIPDDNKWVSFPIKRNDDLLHTSVLFLLDFLYARLWSTMCNARTLIDDNWKETRNHLCKWTTGYNHSFTSLKKALTSKNRNGATKDKTIPIIERILNSIDVKTGKVTIPEYSINMWLTFELFCFSLLREKKPTVKYHFHLKESDLHPDFIIDNDCLVFDAKYKYQYNDINYCDIKDANQFIRFLQSLNHNNNRYSGGILFPSLCKDTDDENNNNIEAVLQKETKTPFQKFSISYPHRQSSI